MDPYSVLGLSQSASAEEIRRSFRRIAAKYHPDRNPGDPNAEKIYKEASKAYDLLTNPRKQGSVHTQRPQTPPPPTIVPVIIRGGRKKRGARRGYMPPGHQPRPHPPINPGSQVPMKPDVKLGSVPLKDLPPWMTRATFFKHKDDRGL